MQNLYLTGTRIGDGRFGSPSRERPEGLQLFHLNHTVVMDAGLGHLRRLKRLESTNPRGRESDFNAGVHELRKPCRTRKNRPLTTRSAGGTPKL